VKRLMYAGILFLSAGLLPLSSLAIGGVYEASLSGGLASTLRLSLRFDEVPLAMAFGGSIDEESLYLSASSDWYIFEHSLLSSIELYAGIGAYIESGDTLRTGLRAPFGIRVLPMEVGELFAELVPAAGIDTTEQNDPDIFALQAALGFRILF
jgi:hypothetical protein